MTDEQKVCQNCKRSFTIESEDFDFYAKIDVPPPTFCPECRFQRRLMFRNERQLYKRECGLCKKLTLSTFSPDKPRTVYCPPCWWSDNWDPLAYGRAYDPSKPFFQQLDELLKEVPLVALGTNHPTLVNSDYVNESGDAKDCYLIFDADYCENVLYSSRLSRIKDSMDLLIAGESELCYESINCGKSSRAFFSEDVTDCVDVFFSKNLVGCSNCFGCVNLRNKSHYIWNRSYSKKDYEKEIAVLKEEMQSREGIETLRKKAEIFWQSVPHKFMHGLQNSDVSGDYLYESKNAKYCFQARGLHDAKYCQFIKDYHVKDAYDYTIWGDNVELIYECINVGAGAHNAKFCYVCALGNTLNTEYSVWCIDVANMFGCSGIRKKKNCILNRQYSEQEFKLLRAQIIADMKENPYIDSHGRIWRYGEFFPYDLSFYGYNETDAQFYFPMNQEKAEAVGWKWHESKPSEHSITIQGSELPSTSREIRDDILEEIVGCASCNRAYRFVPAELRMLRRFQVPLPGTCPECRHRRRFSRLNPVMLWDRDCQCLKQRSYTNATQHFHGAEPCPNRFQTSYAPNRPEVIYCEQCYQREFIS